VPALERIPTFDCPIIDLDGDPSRIIGKKPMKDHREISADVSYAKEEVFPV
jgi:hypothetical protein